MVLGWVGIDLLVVHSIFEWEVVPQMWEIFPHTTVLANPWPKPIVVAQVVHRKLLLRTETSF